MYQSNTMELLFVTSILLPISVILMAAICNGLKLNISFQDVSELVEPWAVSWGCRITCRLHCIIWAKIQLFRP